MREFDKMNEKYSGQFENIDWLWNGTSAEDLKNAVLGISRDASLSKAMRKAKSFMYLAEKSPIAIDREDVFQDKLYGGGLISMQRQLWEAEVAEAHFKTECELVDSFYRPCGIMDAHSDFGHTSPNTRALLKLGIGGLYKRLEKYEKSSENKDYYESCKLALSAMTVAIERLADGIAPYNAENALCLRSISKNAPKNTYEALQLLLVYFYLHEYVCATRVRTFGKLDELLYPFYMKDIESGTFTKAQIKNLLKFFLYKIWLSKVPFDMPIALGGTDKNGNDITNELSYLIAETYNELDIHSPKFHIKVCKKTPKSFIKQILSYIRGGNSSFVFVNDDIAVKGLIKAGIKRADALDYVPIGCYEPAVWGMEIGCTGNGGISLVKALELIMTGGCDNKTGRSYGKAIGRIKTYDDLIFEVKDMIAHFTKFYIDYVSRLEKHYGEMGPDPILSAMYDESVKRGVDVFEGGAKYNSTSVYYYSIATLVDSLLAIKEMVFEKKLISFEELCDVLKNNWEGAEKLRLYALSKCKKYGTGDEEADALAADIAEFLADISLGKPNGRGGVYKPSLFTIDFCFSYGKATMATPDGRYAGEPLSKNLSATSGMDKGGVTELINSVTKMDLTDFPNGTVLDIVLHPSTVMGEGGLEAFYSLLMTYFNKGGLAMHGNVFDVETLKKAQKEPEKYMSLQVRLCGWNTYFVALTEDEQNDFIKNAEAANC